MDQRSRLYKPILILVALSLLVSVSFTQSKLNRSRESMGLTRVTPLENAPPILAFTTVALGGFRGLIANVLWIRASDLQEQDRYFEMFQLADWITKLQPHFPTVWVHQAWNLSYNISIKFTDPKDRWPWVKRALELLRDEGIRYNPGEPLIYRELAWIFQHKMGANLDDAHNEYKKYWADEMYDVLGPGKVDLEELISPTTDESRERSKTLREKYKMDPAWMKEVDTRFGPLEWRLPESHAIYWALMGLEKSKANSLKKDDMANLRRIVFHSMQLAFHRGRLIYPRKGSKDFLYAPNIEVVQQASDAYEEMMKLDPNSGGTFETGHRNFIKTAIYFLYTHNRITAAREWMAILRKKYPNDLPPDMDLETYALSRVSEDMGETDHNRMKSIIEGMLESFFLNLAIGNDDQAVGYQAFAVKLHERFQTAIGKTSVVRVGLPPLQTIKDEVLARFLGPETPLDPELRALLITNLGLPADAGSTNPPVLFPIPGATLSTNKPAAK